MNEINFRKYQDIINKKSNNSENKIKRYFKGLLSRILVVAILFLSLAIFYKSNYNLKSKIDKYIYSDSVSFVKIKNLYDKYLGGILPLKKQENTKEVFNENIKYNDISKYYDGAKLEVENNYLVPSLSEGMVVFIGEKDNYGNTIIIEDLNGVYVWYGNIENSSLKLYDYIDKGSLVGEVSNELYLVFNSDDGYLNYEEYIS